MDFKKILEENNEKYIVDIGYDGRKTIKSIDLKEYPSIIVTGETGSGKSIFLDQIICQLIKNNTSLDMEFYLIDSTGVELNRYADSRYSKEYALRDNEEGLRIISKILNIMDERRDLIYKSECLSVDEYNKKHEDKLNDIVLVIDDSGDFILNEDISKQLTSLIDRLKETNIFFIGAFSNTDNYFFKSNKNLYSSILVSFDMSDSEHAGYINIKGSEDLNIGKFILKDENSEKEYHNFDFDDELIIDTLNK